MKLDAVYPSDWTTQLAIDHRHLQLGMVFGIVVTETLTRLLEAKVELVLSLEVGRGCGDDDLMTQIKTIVLAPFSGALRTIFKPNMLVTIMVRVLQRIGGFVDVPGLCETPE